MPKAANSCSKLILPPFAAPKRKFLWHHPVNNTPQEFKLNWDLILGWLNVPLCIFPFFGGGWTSTPHQLPADASYNGCELLHPTVGSPIPGGFHEFLHGFKPKHHCDLRAERAPPTATRTPSLATTWRQIRQRRRLWSFSPSKICNFGVYPVRYTMMYTHIPIPSWVIWDWLTKILTSEKRTVSYP